MTTNSAIVRTPDGEIEEYSGVIHLEEGEDPESEATGIALQFRVEDPDSPETEFVEGGEIVAVYDEVAKDYAADAFLQYVDPEAVAN